MKRTLEQQSCATCRCWVAEPGVDAGLCKRFPPAVLVVADELTSAYPSTGPDDICGEYARRLQS